MTTELVPLAVVERGHHVLGARTLLERVARVLDPPAQELDQPLPRVVGQQRCVPAKQGHRLAQAGLVAIAGTPLELDAHARARRALGQRRVHARDQRAGAADPLAQSVCQAADQERLEQLPVLLRDRPLARVQLALEPGIELGDRVALPAVADLHQRQLRIVRHALADDLELGARR